MSGALKGEQGTRVLGSALSHIANCPRLSASPFVLLTCLVWCREASFETQCQTALAWHLQESKDSSCPGQPGGFGTVILVFFIVLEMYV